MLTRFRLVFFLSGCAALMFEALWFRLATLAFGSSVWASSLVLASFMGGLALGNAWAGARGAALRRPLRMYALLELAIGVGGVALVLALPALAGLLAPLFRPFLDQPVLLNVLRAAIAFASMLVPATAMGATLPIVVKELRRHDPNFGRNLGRLYGWNTLGGVAGALGVELVLIGPLGLRGSALTAAALNLVAAGLALAGDRARPVEDEAPRASPSVGSRARVRGLLAAGALSGAILLALEVVWFRFVLLFAFGTSRNFAIMLAVVLAGIGLGALAASGWLGRRPQDHALAPLVALLSATACTLAYRGFRLPGTGPFPGNVVLDSLWLMLPTCLLSGVLFTFLGRALQEELGDETRAAARLTLANTLGGMAGALAGGFVLLPTLGMEASFFVLAAGYGLVALCAARQPQGRVRWALWVAGAAAALSTALFPFGLMRDRFLPFVRQRVGGGRVLAVREGRTETIQYLANEVPAQPTEYRLVTNSISMSGTNYVGRRYMRLFVTWALAVNPRAERALLISYGVGTTAKALTDSARLRSIDVVDTSREILDLAPLPFPPPATSPLEDPRVEVHVEDGRFFLQTTPRTFDLITAEPPPLKAAGVVNLYSREYFQLIRGRLAPGGVTTYWLPVYQLLPAETASVVRAFCGVFEDCTLWTASGLEWMLAGTNRAGAPSAGEFGEQWKDPVVGLQLRADGFESPEQLGACFLGDAGQLAPFAATAPALVDDRPRLMSAEVAVSVNPVYADMMAPAAARRRFAQSAVIARLWPEAIRAGTDAWFGPQELMNGLLLQVYGGPPVPRLLYLRDALADPALVTLPLWVQGFAPAQTADLGSAGDAPAEGARGALQAAQAMARRDYADAERRFTLLMERHPDRRDIAPLRVLAALLGGAPERARSYAARAVEREGSEPGVWEWLEDLLDEPAAGAPVQAPRPDPRAPARAEPRS
ncbi:MAG: spermidine synthase [Vicinamibacteria bacterium]